MIHPFVARSLQITNSRTWKKKWKYKCPRCLVCGFETSIRDGLKLKFEGCTDARCKKSMVCCSNPGCNIKAHAHINGESKNFFFNVPSFIGKTCVEIAHEDAFRGMFLETNNLGLRQKKPACRGHRLHKNIQKQYIAIIEKTTNWHVPMKTTVIWMEHPIKKTTVLSICHAKGKN